MINHSRRRFIAAAALLGAAASGSGKPVQAASRNELSPDRRGVLVDTTVCIGCRTCEWACRKAHGYDDEKLENYQSTDVFKKVRRPDETRLTVINQYSQRQTETFVKFQCMHCDEPACVSACIVGAFHKEEKGSVLWDTDKCIGCRYCMVACPFQVPAFEYEKAFRPDIIKCDFCKQRTDKGERPACVAECPVEAMIFGTRAELLQIAKDRIRRHPEKYKDHIFGETEVGGTAWLYLAERDFAEIGFPKLGRNPAPGVSESIQHGIFAYFVPPVSLYALLGGIMWLMKHREEPDD
ncbi:MAG TPA: 4Fe-4S dicluster domain-containing protein [bacterium]|nr:4Fe-4S dicluster domain-containing protein [bacterium]